VYSNAICLAVMASWQGIKMEALKQSWSVIVSIVSYPWDLGSLVMKSRVMVSKGLAWGAVVMGKGVVLDLWGCFCMIGMWHSL